MRHPGKSHIKLYSRIKEPPAGWYCYVHGCWNYPKQRLCLCKQPKK